MKYLEDCLAHLRKNFAGLHDKRTGKNTQYLMEDITMAAFSLFFMQQPSFLAYQRTLNQRRGRDNTQTLFSMEKIPTDNCIRKMLDGIDPGHFEDCYFFMVDELASSVPSIVRNMPGEHTLIALDGSEYHCSKNIGCSSCSRRLRSDGTEENFHAFLAATIVNPYTKTVFSLPPEFVTPQDGAKKQDCEWRAVHRWMKRVGPRCARYNPVYPGDDLYAKHDLCELIASRGEHFIFTCKDSSHKTLCEFKKGLPCSTIKEIQGKGSQKREYAYSWICDLPIRDGEDAIRVNWIDVTIGVPGKKPGYHASFITSLTPDAGNIAELVRCARARWKIENETFNVLKNNGYHLEHNFGHGKETLSSVLVALNLLAFSLHSGCDVIKGLWHEARTVAGSRQRFFNILWSLTIYIVYPSWTSFLDMIITGQHPPST